MHTPYRSIKFAVLAIVLVCLTVSQSAFAASHNDKNAERAAAAYETLQKYFYQPETKLYHEHYPDTDSNKYSYLWPYASALQATVSLAQIPKLGENYKKDVNDRLEGLAAYWNDSTVPPGYDSYVRPPLGGGGDKFYDDNDWIALELIKIYRITGEQDVLNRAKQIFDLQVYGWDNDPSHPCPGGVFWTQASWSRDRNTVSNAPAAEIGLHLYEITGESRYLDWSQKMYDWVNGCMLAPNGLYWDHIDLNGDINKTQWSYNQGTMIGASVLLYKATGDRSYLDRAESIADAALKYYGNSRLYTQPIVFNSIFFENLLLLDNVNHDPKYRKYMQAYADEMWTTVRDEQTGLLEFDANRSTELLEQAPLAAIYASLAAGQEKEQ